MNLKWTSLVLATVAVSLAQSPIAAAASPPGTNDCPRYGSFVPPFSGPQGGGLELRGSDMSDRCIGLWGAQGSQVPPGPVSERAQAILTRFVQGVRSGKPDRGDMSPDMAHQYRDGSSASIPHGGRIPAPKSARLMGADAFGNDVYAVALAGGGASWQIHLDRDGRIEAAFFNGRV